MNRHLSLSLLLVPVLSAFSAYCHAQSDTDKSWFSDIRVRKSAQTGSDDLSKPATLNYSSTGGGQSSYATDIAFSKLLATYEHGKGPSHRSWETSAFIETHRNTLSNKKQDASFVGLNFAGLYGLVPNYPLTIPRASVLYGQDKVADTKSVLVQSDVTLLHAGYGLNQEIFLNTVSFMWSPILGVEYQRALDTPTNTNHGAISRLYGSLELRFTPLKMLDRLSATLYGKTWRDMGRSGFYDEGNHSRNFESISIDWDMIPKQRAVVGFSREIGENPTEGLPKSAVTKLVFKFKFN